MWCGKWTLRTTDAIMPYREHTIAALTAFYIGRDLESSPEEGVKEPAPVGRVRRMMAGLAL